MLVRLAFRLLFYVAIVPTAVFMLLAAIADSLAWKLEDALDFIVDGGWPE